METTSDEPVRGVGVGAVVVGAGLLAVLLAGVIAWSGAGAGPGEGRYTIRMIDYGYEPSQMTWHVGEKVTLTFVNASDAHPGKPHEWMLGRDVNTEPGVFGPKVTDGFATTFFDDVDIEVVDGAGLSMLMAGGARLSGKPAADVLLPGAMDMSGMDMSGSGDAGAMSGMDMSGGASPGQDGGTMPGMDKPAESGAMDMSGTDKSGGDMAGMADVENPAGSDAGGMQAMDMGGSGGADMGGMAGMDMGGMAGMDMGGEAPEEGFMPVVEQSGHLTITFTVPDKPGLWQFGCFQQSGQHYLNGMRGTVNVVEG